MSYMNEIHETHHANCYCGMCDHQKTAKEPPSSDSERRLVRSSLGRADANQKAWSMSYKDRLSLVKQREWRSSGHWDNWFHPVSGWNYSLHGAVVNILMYPPNAERTDRAADNGGVIGPSSDHRINHAADSRRSAMNP